MHGMSQIIKKIKWELCPWNSCSVYICRCFIIEGSLDMKAFIYIYTGKQSNVLTAFINVLQNLSFFFYLFNDFHRRIFFLSFPPERLPSLFPRHLWSFVCKELSFLITLSKKIKFNHTNDKDPNQVTNTLMKCWQMLEKINGLMYFMFLEKYQLIAT